MLIEDSVHKFMISVRVHGHILRALGIKNGSPPVLCVWRPSSVGENPVFDARILSGSRILVTDPLLSPVLVALFASFTPPVRIPTIIENSDGYYDAIASRIDYRCNSRNGTRPDNRSSVADFSGVSRIMFRLLFPELLFASVNVFDLTSMVTCDETSTSLSLSGPRITCVSLETIFYGLLDSETDERVLRESLAYCDLSRLREIEVRFGVKLYPISESMARRRDTVYSNTEALMMRSGHAYIDATSAVSNATSLPGHLNNPRDHIRGTMTVSDRNMRRIGKEQNVDIRVGAELVFEVGSYPMRSWYVHSTSETETVLAPWFPVVLGSRVDYIGKDAEDRDVMAVIGTLEPDSTVDDLVVYELKAGMLVGDVSKDVYGELYATPNGSWAVLGGRPNGEPAIDSLVREFAAISRRESGGRFDYMCYNKPGIPTKRLCDEAGGVWDRPCTRDHECPYFSADARGGCLDGYCEMPLGVDNVAFTRGVGTPVCSNCGGAVDGDPLRCCQNLSNPKYAWQST